MEKPKQTQRTLKKIKESSKYDVEPINDFISQKTRKTFQHLCDRCANKRYCDKWCGSIMLVCDRFEAKKLHNKFKR